MRNTLSNCKLSAIHWPTLSTYGLLFTILLITLPYPAVAQAPHNTQKSLSFHNLHTEEHLTVIYWANGQYQPDALRAIEHLFRDHRTGDTHAIDPALLDILHTLRTRLKATEPFQIISAYRSAKTNAMLAKRSQGVAKKSLHTQGMAIDIRLPGHNLAVVRDTALAMKMGGVGYYPKSNFIHLDTGRVRSWQQ